MAPTTTEASKHREKAKLLLKRLKFGEGDEKNRGGGFNGGHGGDGGDSGSSKGSGNSESFGKGGNGQDREHFGPPPSPGFPPNVDATSLSVAKLTSTAVTTVPTTIPTTLIVTSTTAEISSSSSSSSSAASSDSLLSSTSASTSIFTSTPTLSSVLTTVSSFSPISTATTAILPATTSFIPSADLPNPTKGLNSQTDEIQPATMTKMYNNPVMMLSEMAPLATTSSTLDMPALPNIHHEDGLPPIAEHILAVFGAIGAIIILSTLVYFVARVKNIDLISLVRGRKFCRGGPRGWYGWRQREMHYTPNSPPPHYTGFDEEFDLLSEQKVNPTEHQVDIVDLSRVMPSAAAPKVAATLPRGIYTQRQDSTHEALHTDPLAFRISLVYPTEQPTDQPLYSQPSYFPTSTDHQTYNSNAASAGLSRQNSDPNEVSQTEVRYMSFLSSLSSGFGDQMIIPEPVPTKSPDDRASWQNCRRSRKLSWTASGRGVQGDRDTVYTATSAGSTPPRFRTINSWVAHQTGCVEKAQQKRNDVLVMPEVSEPLQPDLVYHQRRCSEDLAFRHHPGNEVELSRGSRIPSKILDKKFGIS